MQNCGWFNRLDLDHFCLIFGKQEFVTRVVVMKMFKTLLYHYDRGGSNKSKELYDLLSKKNWGGLKEHSRTNNDGHHH